MRIIGGKNRGAKLHTPQSADIRPTADKTRQALFNILTNAFKINFTGKKIADICAGTGALGFEALSHGAESCHFYDKASLALVKQNAEKLNYTDRSILIKADIHKLPPAPHPFDLIFIDPPYHQGFHEVILPQLISQHYVHQDTLILCEEDKKNKINIPTTFHITDQRHYGKTQILILNLTLIQK